MGFNLNNYKQYISWRKQDCPACQKLNADCVCVVLDCMCNSPWKCDLHPLNDFASPAKVTGIGTTIRNKLRDLRGTIRTFFERLSTRRR